MKKKGLKTWYVERVLFQKISNTSRAKSIAIQNVKASKDNKPLHYVNGCFRLLMNMLTLLSIIDNLIVIYNSKFKTTISRDIICYWAISYQTPIRILQLAFLNLSWPLQQLVSCYIFLGPLMNLSFSFEFLSSDCMVFQRFSSWHTTLFQRSSIVKWT